MRDDEQMKIDFIPDKLELSAKLDLMEVVTDKDIENELFESVAELRQLLPEGDEDEDKRKAIEKVLELAQKLQSLRK